MSLSDDMALRQWTTRRDADAFRTIVQRHAGMVYATCLRIVRNAADAEDVTQECFEILVREKGETRAHALGPWLHGMATNRSRMRMRSESRLKNREADYAAREAEHEDLQWNEVYGYVDEAIGELPEDLRVPVVAHFLCGQSHAEISRTTGAPRRTVSKRIRRALDRIGKALGRRGVTVASSALAGMLTANLADAAQAPVSLTTSLGKLALTCTARPAPTGVATAKGAGVLGGFLVAKKGILALTAVALATAGLWAVVHRRPPEQAQSIPDKTPQTLESGQAVAASSPEGAHAVAAKGVMSSQSAALPKRVTAGEDTTGTATIKGRVFDEESGVGIAGVTVEGALRSNHGKSEGTATTDEKGCYRLCGLPEGLFVVRRDDIPGYPDPSDWPQRKVEITPGAQVEGIDFALARGLSVTGVTLDSRGRPVPDARVKDLTWRGGLFPTDSTYANDEGAFELLGFTAQQRFTIQARTEGMVSAPMGPFTVNADGYHDVRLTLFEGTSIAGTVRNRHGAPLSGREVGVLPTAQPVFHIGSVTTGKTGDFEITGLYPGTFTVAIAPRGGNFNLGGRIKLKEVTVKAGQHIANLALTHDEDAGLAISGRILDTHGKPIARATINAFSSGGRESLTALSGADGSYRLPSLREGQYELSVYGPNHTPQRLDGIAAGERDVDFVLKGLGTIEGRVIRADNGAPVTDFEILQHPGRWTTLPARVMDTAVRIENVDGAFRLEEARLQEVTVVALAAGLATAFQPVAVTSAEAPVRDVIIRMQPEATAKGVVTNQAGRAVAGALIGVGPMPTPLEWREGQALARTDHDGAFQLGGLGPAPVTLWAFHPDYLPASLQADLGSTGTEPLEVVLTSGTKLEGTVRIGGRPLRNATISADGAFTDSQSDGGYSLTGVPGGTFSVTASAGSGGTSGSTSRIEKVVELHPGESGVVDFDFIDGTAEIEANVTVNGQIPASANAFVVVTADSGERQVCRASNTKGGLCQLSGLPTGILSLRVQTRSADGIRRRRIVDVETVAGEVTRLDIDLSGACVVEGTVSDFHDPQQVAVVVVEGAYPAEALKARGLAELEGLVLGRSRLDEDGMFHIGGLDPATYTVIALEFEPSEPGSTAPRQPSRHTHAVVAVADKGGAHTTLTLPK